MCINRLRSMAVSRRLTNKNGLGINHGFLLHDLLLRAKRRASLSLDDGRPRPNLGLDLASGRALWPPLSRPLGQVLMNEGAELMRTSPKTVRIGSDTARAIGRDPPEFQVPIIQNRL